MEHRETAALGDAVNAAARRASANGGSVETAVDALDRRSLGSDAPGTAIERMQLGETTALLHFEDRPIAVLAAGFARPVILAVGAKGEAASRTHSAGIAEPVHHFQCSTGTYAIRGASIVCPLVAGRREYVAA